MCVCVYIYTQLTLEQQEFELCGSTDTQRFFNSKYFSTAESGLWKNPRYGGPTINHTGIFYFTDGRCP